MPTFIDRHHAASVPHEVRRQLMREAREGHLDARGVRPMSHWLEDGWLYCVLEAPTTTAVCDHHKMHGLACDTVREMEGLHGCRAMSPDNRERVRAAIQHFWHAVPA